MEDYQIALLIAGGLILLILFIRIKTKKRNKKWLIFEHQEGDPKNPLINYYAQDRLSGRTTNYFENKNKLLRNLK